MANSSGRYLRPGVFAGGLAVLAVGALLSACGSSNSASSTTNSSATTTVAPTTTMAPMTMAPPQNVALEIETGKMAGKPGWPRFTPSDITVHQGAPVTLTITSYDDGTAPLPTSLATYETIQGGTETVDGTAVTSVPNANISHTFSVPNLGVNVLIPAVPSGVKTTTVTFTFTPAKTGTFTWHCFAPCGDGADGMGGAMATMGWMEGNITVS